MRVHILNPGSRRESAAGHYSDSMFPMPPKGIAGIAAVARKLGHETSAEDQYASGGGAREVAQTVVEREIDVLGIGCLAPNLPMVEDIVRRVKTERPQTHIVLGNTYASYRAVELLERLPINSVVLGEGESAFAEILRRIEAGAGLSDLPGVAYRDGDGIKNNGPAGQISDLDALPFPAWDLLRPSDYLAPPRLLMRDRLFALEAARGCPWRCSYCSQILAAPKVRKRSAASVADEIAWAVKEFGATSFGFVDAIFPLSLKDAREFASCVEDRGLAGRIRWFSTTRSDIVNPEMLKSMRAAGCRLILYGFESAGARHLDAADKRLDPRAAFEAVKMTREAGIRSYGVFMIGFPGETPSEARQTIRYARDLDCDVSSFSRVTPYPGTPMFEKFKAVLPADTPPWQWNNQYRPARGERLWTLPGMSAGEIDGLLREAMIKFYARPKIMIRQIRLGLFGIREMWQGIGYLARDAVHRLARSETASAGS